MKMRVRDTRILSFFSDSTTEEIEEVKLKKAKYSVIQGALVDSEYNKPDVERIQVEKHRVELRR